MAIKKSKVLLAIFILMITISLIKFPAPILVASKNGLNLWWTTVFPSLLPFFILSEMLISLGVVHFLGVLLEPFMRPLFRVPGVGAFVFTMGMASGFPSGAKYTVRMREENKISKIEGERLLAFTNFANPLFIFAAISVGFLSNPKVGILLAVSHYTANILVGLCMRFYKRKNESIHNNYEKISLNQAFLAMLKKQKEDERPFGKVFGDAVTSSVQTLLLIGGFIISFSVLYETLHLIYFWNAINTITAPLMTLIKQPISMMQPIFAGILEITIGSKFVSSATELSLFTKCIIISGILGFAGFSVMAQVASIISNSDMSLLPFFLGRVLQSFFSMFLTIILFKPLYRSAATTFIPVNSPEHSSSFLFLLQAGLERYGPLITICTIVLACVFLLKEQFANKNVT